jgi:hypothetical protein
MIEFSNYFDSNTTFYNEIPVDGNILNFASTQIVRLKKDF